MVVESLNVEWHDAARQRTVPVRIYYAASAPSPCRAIVFSPGVGGSRADYAYLGQHWARQGYVCVHLEHPGSNTAVWQTSRDPLGAMRAAVLDPANALNRALDVRLALDRLEGLNAAPGPLRGRLDLGRVGAAGHSFGASTTLAAAGQTLLDAQHQEHHLADPRIRAAVVLSPSPPPQAKPRSRLLAGIRVPIMHITGRNDESPIGLTPAAERRAAFDQICGAEQFLVLFHDADHMTFTDPKPGRAARSRRAVVHPLVQTMTTLFWDVFLNGSPATSFAEQLAALLANEATVEHKPPAP
jgi:predicted dienelactone hydrolase